jgi:glycosyltransferase involved in cell wall biosynthesis
VFPSHYEGFGFPVLEAFSCDCPAITSNGSSLPGVGGDAAVYVEPSDSDGLAVAIRKVLTDSEYADALREKGRERVGEFTWSRTAEMTMDVYRSVLS